MNHTTTAIWLMPAEKNDRVFRSGIVPVAGVESEILEVSQVSGATGLPLLTETCSPYKTSDCIGRWWFLRNIFVRVVSQNLQQSRVTQGPDDSSGKPWHD